MKLYDVTIRRRSRRRRGPSKSDEERKDYLIQARVPRDLDEVLKKDAKRRRLSVSHLIRNVLQDTYELVDGVIEDVDQLVQDSVELTGRVTRDAKHIAQSASALGARKNKDKTRARAAPDFDARTADIYAWQAVVLHRSAHCERCTRELERGDAAHLGLCQTPATLPRWLCPDCLAKLTAR